MAVDTNTSVLCDNRNILYGDLCVTFTGNTEAELLVDLCQHHGMLLLTLNYSTCGDWCHLDT